MAGFAWSQDQLLSAGADTYAVIAPAGSSHRISGKISFYCKRTGSVNDNALYIADLIWDGTTLTASNIISEANGALALATTPLRVNSGNIEFGLFDASAITARIDVNFDGVYLA